MGAEARVLKAAALQACLSSIDPPPNPRAMKGRPMHTQPTTTSRVPQRLRRSLPLVLSVLLLAACAGMPPPTAQMALASAAVNSAVAAGAVEMAPAEMALSREKLRRAQTAMAAEDHATALRLSQQAQADAQLAEAKAEAEKARRSAQALQEAGRALREEMARQPK